MGDAEGMWETVAVATMVGLFILPSVLLYAVSIPIFSSINASTATPNFGSIFNTSGPHGTSAYTTTVYAPTPINVSCTASPGFVCQDGRMIYDSYGDIEFEYGQNVAASITNIKLACIISNNDSVISVPNGFMANHSQGQEISSNDYISVQNGNLAETDLYCYYPDGVEARQAEFPQMTQGELLVNYTEDSNQSTHTDVLGTFMPIYGGELQTTTAATTVPQQTATTSISGFTKLYLNQSLTVGNISIKFLGLGYGEENSTTGAPIGNRNYSEFWAYYNGNMTSVISVAPQKFDTFNVGRYGGTMYNVSILVNATYYPTSDPSNQWITVALFNK